VGDMVNPMGGAKPPQVVHHFGGSGDLGMVRLVHTVPKETNDCVRQLLQLVTRAALFHVPAVSLRSSASGD
jgi:hypothetical protein